MLNLAKLEGTTKQHEEKIAKFAKAQIGCADNNKNQTSKAWDLHELRVLA